MGTLYDGGGVRAGLAGGAREQSSSAAVWEQGLMTAHRRELPHELGRGVGSLACEEVLGRWR